jgi:predicted transcriptional regulator
VPAQLMVNESLTPAQARAARAWLNWSKQELAERSGVSEKTIARFENGQSLPYSSTLSRVRAAFEDAGIHFQFEGATAKGIRIL